MPQTAHFEFANAAVSDRDELAAMATLAEMAKMLHESVQVSAGAGPEGTPVEQRRYLLTTDEVRLLLAEGHPKFASVSESDPTPETNDDMAAVRALPAMQTLAMHYQRGWLGDVEIVESAWVWDVRRARAKIERRGLGFGVAEVAAPRVWALDRSMLLPDPVWLVAGAE